MSSQNQFGRTKWALCGVITLAALLVASTTLAAEPGVDVVRLPITSLDGLDPSHAADGASMAIVAATYEGLMRFEAETGGLALGQAQRYEVTGNGRTYTFTLREDARWSNGEAVTAYDFERAWVRVLYPSVASQIAWLISEEAGVLGAEAFQTGWEANVAGIEAVDARTLVVRLAAPNDDFLALLTTPAFMPVHVSVGVSVGVSMDVSIGAASGRDALRFPNERITNGRWQFTAESTGRFAVLRHNTHYYGHVAAPNTPSETSLALCQMLPHVATRLGGSCGVTALTASLTR